MSLLVPQSAVLGVADRNAKAFHEVRQSNAAAGSTLRSSLFYAKWNPAFELNSAGTAIDIARITRAATGVQFFTTGADTADPDIDVVFATTLSVGASIDEVNGANDTANSAPVRRWRAGLGDYPRNEVLGATSGVAVAITDAMLGEFERGLAVTANHTALTNDKFGVGCGVEYALRGAGAFFPDYLETGYNYVKSPSTTPGDVGRGGGIDASAGEGALPQKASKFTYRGDAADQLNPARARFQTRILSIDSSIDYSGAHSLLIQDLDGNEIYRQPRTSGVNHFTMDVLVNGPAFVSTIGEGASTLNTDGFITVDGEIRLA